MVPELRLRLARRMTADDGPYLAEYLGTAFEELVLRATLPPTLDAPWRPVGPADRVLRQDVLVRRVAEGAGVSAGAVRMALAGRGSVPPAPLWRIGESLRHAGLTWSSGLCALCHVPSYRGHALSVARSLLPAMRSEFVRSRAPGESLRLWNAVAFVLMQTDVQHRAEADALADFPEASMDFSVQNWLTAVCTWRSQESHDLAVFSENRFASYLAKTWDVHRARESHLREPQTSLDVRLSSNKTGTDEFAPIDEAIFLERARASLGVRARAQDAIDALVESLDRLFSA